MKKRASGAGPENPPLKMVSSDLLRFLENWLILYRPASRQISHPSRIHLALISPNLGCISAARPLEFVLMFLPPAGVTSNVTSVTSVTTRMHIGVSCARKRRGEESHAG